jgi:hypothetical protein
MNDAEFRAATYLLERAIAFLPPPTSVTTVEHRRTISALVVEFELLRAQLAQPTAQTQRN